MRAVRSYVRREGRMTAAQRAALYRCWSRYGIDLADRQLDLDCLFGRFAPRVLEIGFGMGDTLAAMAEAHPENDYLGMEVYRPGVGHLFRRLEDRQITNVRVIVGDAMEALGQMIPGSAFDAVLLFFPDPWPKKRHHKRRLVQPMFAAEIARVLKDRGHLYMATDSADYAAHMLSVLEASGHFANYAGAGRYAERPEWWVATKFEDRARRLGRPNYYLQFSRKASTASSPA